MKYALTRLESGKQKQLLLISDNLQAITERVNEDAFIDRERYGYPYINEHLNGYSVCCCGYVAVLEEFIVMEE